MTTTRRQASSSSRASAGQPPTPAKQIAGFIARFDPALARVIRACRAALRKRLPTAALYFYYGADLPDPKGILVKSISAKQGARQ